MAQTLRVQIIGDTSGYSAALQSAASATTQFGRNLTTAGRSLTRSVTLPLVGIGVASVKMADDFSQSLTRITGLAGVSEKQVAAWSTQLLRLGPEVGKSPRELADALYFVASSGVSTGKAMDVLTASAKASEAGLGDTQTVADALTSVMNAYGEANITAAQAADVLVATVREGKGEASDFAPIIGNVVAVASQMGVKFNEVGAALAGMTRLGTDAATAGTQLQAFFSQLLKATPQTEKGLKAVGLSAAGLRDELKSKGLLATLQTLKDAFHGNTAEMAKAFPNVRALRHLLALIGNQADNTAKLFKRMSDTTGSLATAFDEARKKSGFKFDQLKASAEAAGIALGIVLLPSLQKVADWLAKLAIAYTQLSPQTQQFIALAGAIAVAIGPLLIITGTLARAIGALGPVFALAASPIGLLVVALAAAGAAMAAAVLYPEQFAAALQRLGLSAQQAGQVVTTLQGIFAQVKAVVGQAVNDIMAIWQRMGPSITAAATATWNLVKSQIEAALNIIKGIINVFAGLFTGDWSRMWQGIQQIASGIWTNITSMFRFFMAELVAVARALWAALGPALTSVWTGIKSGFTSAWAAVTGGVRQAFGAIVGAIQGAVGKAVSAATAVGKGIVDGIRRGLATIVSVVKGGLDKIWGVISGVAKSAFGAAVAIGSAIMHGIASGIMSAVGAAISAVKGAVGSVIHAAGGFLGIHSPSTVAADQLGKPIIEGIAQGIIQNVGLAEDAIKRAAQRVVAFAQATAIYNAMVAAGKVIGLGHARGIVMGMFQGAPTIAQTALSTAKAIAASGPAVAAAAKTIGLSAAQAVAAGVFAGTPSAGAQIKTALASAVATARTDFITKFDAMAQAALAKFDARVAAWKPFSGTLLAKMQMEDTIKGMSEGLAAASAAAEGGGAALAATIQNDIGPKIGDAMSTALGQIAGAKTMASLATVSRAAQTALTDTITSAAAPAVAAAQSAVDAAQAALTAAQAGGDPEAIKAAQTALDTAVGNQATLNAAIRTEIETGTGLLVTAEADRHTQLAATQRTGLATQLAELKTDLAEHPKAWDTAQQQVLAILNKYLGPMKTAGHNIATNFANGIREGIPEVRAAAAEMAAAAAANVPQSPAKEGPLAFDIHAAGKRWAQGFGKGIRDGNMGSILTNAAMPFPSMTTRSASASPFSNMAGAAASQPVIVQLVVDRKVLSELVIPDLLRFQNRNVQVFST